MCELVDELDARRESRRDVLARGYAFDMVQVDVDLGAAGTVTREFITHRGAVAVVPMRGEPGQEEVLLIQQYRHPVGAADWEIPAGLLDVAGEAPELTAARELAEEADLDARTWHVLTDFWTSPGSSDEALRVFLARDLRNRPTAHARDGEELDMPTRWVALDEVVQAVLSGRVHNPSLVVGALAAHAARASGWTTLRPADSPWPAHPAFRHT